MRMLRNGVTPRAASRMRLSRFTILRCMKLFFAAATHAGQSRVRERIRVTLKKKLILIILKFNYILYVIDAEKLPNYSLFILLFVF
jgi:hypothetical protein